MVSGLDVPSPHPVAARQIAARDPARYVLVVNFLDMIVSSHRGIENAWPRELLCIDND